MPTDIEYIRTIRTQTLAKLVEITLNPKPNYSIEGQSVSHASLLEILQKGLKDLNELLTQFDPYIVESVGI